MPTIEKRAGSRDADGQAVRSGTVPFVAEGRDIDLYFTKLLNCKSKGMGASANAYVRSGDPAKCQAVVSALVRISSNGGDAAEIAKHVLARMVTNRMQKTALDQVFTLRENMEAVPGFKELFEYDRDDKWPIRKAAMYLVDDMGTLLEIAKYDSSESVRTSTIRRLDNASLLSFFGIWVMRIDSMSAQYCSHNVHVLGEVKLAFSLLSDDDKRSILDMVEVYGSKAYPYSICRMVKDHFAQDSDPLEARRPAVGARPELRAVSIRTWEHISVPGSVLVTASKE